MAATVRLTDRENRLLERAQRRLGRTRARSALVREAIAGYWTEKLAREDASPYDAIRDRVGCWRGAPPDLSERARERVREALLARRARPR